MPKALVKCVRSDDYCAMQVGDTLPSVLLQEGNPKTTVNVKELFAGKKGILFGVPGAFTPGCSKVQHIQITVVG